MVVTVPLNAYRDVPVAPLEGKVVIDTNNYYPQRATPRPTGCTPARAAWATPAAATPTRLREELGKAVRYRDM